MSMEDYKAIIVMVGCQVMYSVVTLSSRVVFLQGMSSRVFVVYRQFIAFLLIAPLVYFSRRGTERSCRMGWKSFWFISLVSFIGVTINQNLYSEGVYLVSSSVASALSNLVPAITFIMAYALGLEKINLRRLRSIAKIIGTITCASSAAAMALLKGPKLLNMELFLHGNLQAHNTWLLGCLLICGSTCCWSLWLILQVHVTACYPDHLSLTAWMCLIAALQSSVLTVAVEPSLDVWKLSSPFQLFACIFAGLTSAVTFFGQAWCIARRGPLFSALFNPLCTVVVTILACLLMREELFTGSVIGGLGVIIGLYIVLWGKAKDHQRVEEEETSVIKHQQGDQTAIWCSSRAPDDDDSYGKIDLEAPLLSKEVLAKIDG